MLPLTPAIAVNCMAFNHNGNLLVTGGVDGMIRLFGKELGRERFQLLLLCITLCVCICLHQFLSLGIFPLVLFWCYLILVTLHLCCIFFAYTYLILIPPSFLFPLPPPLCRCPAG